MWTIISFYLIPILSLGWLSRIHGGGKPNLPLGLETWLISLWIGVLAYLVVDPVGLWGWGSIFITSALAFLGLRTGHGQYMTMPPMMYLREISTPEKIDPFVSLFFGKDPKLTSTYKSGRVLPAIYAYGETKAYWRNVFGMSITGLIVTLGLAINLLLHGHPFLGILAALAGAGKSIPYMLGWSLFADAEPTVIGEWGRGILLGILSGAVLSVLLTT